MQAAGPGLSDLPRDGFGCRVNEDGLGIACVCMAGELDIASAPRLERTLRGAELQSQQLVLDLRGLTFMDSFGLRLIVAGSHRAHRAGRRLMLVPGPPQVQRLLGLSGVADDLEVVEPGDLDPAVQVLLRTARTV